MNQKPLLQPAEWMIQPRMGAKIINAKYCEALKIAEARPRSLAGNQDATMRPFPGKTGAWANPATSRKRKIAVKAVAKPVSRAQIDQTTIPMPYTNLEPKRSSNAP